MQYDFPPTHGGLHEAQARLQVFGQSICPLGSEVEMHFHNNRLYLCEIKELRRRWRRSTLHHIALFSIGMGGPRQLICRVYDPKLYEAVLGEVVAILPLVWAVSVRMENCSRKPNR